MGYISFEGRVYSSLVDYVQECIKDNCPWITFIGLQEFNELFGLGLFKPNGGRRVQLRTSDQGRVDRCYFVNEDRTLEGIVGEVYPGKKGVHEPEEILQGQDISDGWFVLGQDGRFVFNFRERFGWEDF